MFILHPPRDLRKLQIFRKLYSEIDSDIVRISNFGQIEDFGFVGNIYVRLHVYTSSTHVYVGKKHYEYLD